jgi:hypothetical protein
MAERLKGALSAVVYYVWCLLCMAMHVWKWQDAGLRDTLKKGGHVAAKIHQASIAVAELRPAQEQRVETDGNGLDELDRRILATMDWESPNAS